MTILRCSPTLLLLALCGAAVAGDDDFGCREHRLETLAPGAGAAFDALSGRDLQNYPPNRAADFQHMKLDLVIPDMNTPKLSATQTLTLTPVGAPLTTLTLDAQALTVLSMTVPGRDVAFEHDGRRLTITFSPPLEVDQAVDVITEYELNDPPLGLVWTPESPAWPGRAAQIHTQGQPETNSFWFPCLDFPNERLTTELIVTVPAGYIVSSNGRLLKRERGISPVDSPEGLRNLAAHETFHWLQDQAHVSYLVSLVVGKFDVVDVGTKSLAMPVYVPPGRGGDVRATFDHTRDMVAHFEKLLDEPYPWDRYAQLVVWNFGSGGMENTGATSLYDTAIFEPAALLDHDLDGLISHELAHQWFGDLITCNSWEHIWLNEGFATYMTALWLEKRDGVNGYQRQILENFDSVINADTADAAAATGMASKVYSHPWEVFRRPANPYSKGSSILHMLRTMLGDDAFFRAVRLYIDRNAHDTVETSDLRSALEEVSGRSLDQFFRQWCTRPGIPHLTVVPTWDEASHTLSISVEQTQRIDDSNPAFEFDLPLLIGGSPGHAGSPNVLPITGRSEAFTIELQEEPTMLAFNAGLSVIADITVMQPVERWLAQLGSGPTLVSRIQAARALNGDTSLKAAEVLRRVAADKREAVALRVEAVKSLAARGNQGDVRSLNTTAPDSWEVRLAVVESLAPLANRDENKDNQAMRDSVGEVLADRATRDKSTKVRAAAIRGLGKLADHSWDKLVLGALDTPSQHDAIRQAALDALIDLNPPGALEHAMRLARPGNDGRTRPMALNTIAKLPHRDKAGALKFLTSMLEDREIRTWRGAGQAIVDLGDARGIPTFETMAATARAEEVRRQFTQWAEELSAKSAETK